ncbi:MAG: serine/threonine-protein kinase [Sandaracinaceae bacterium]
MPLLTPEERLGTLLAGKYRIEKILGQGGMGVVFAATHEWTERPVAVKLLHPQYASDDEIRKRFLREARTAAKLQHDNVVDVLDMGHEDGAVYLVLEMLHGSPLDEFGRGSAPLPPEVVVAAMLPVLDALRAAHAAGVVHRDLKPDNIFIHRKGRTVVPKVVDFGIAKVVETEASLTSTGALIGTPQYMSPEQASGASDLGPQSDVWSIGVVLYELLSGSLPFEAESMIALLLAVATTDPVPLEDRAPELPPALIALVMQTLTRDRDVRVASVAEFASRLREVAEDVGWDVDAPLTEAWPKILDGERPAASVSPSTPRPKTLSSPAFDPTVAATPAPSIVSRPPRWRWGLMGAAALLLLVGGTVVALSGPESSPAVGVEVEGLTETPSRAALAAGAEEEPSAPVDVRPPETPSAEAIAEPSAESEGSGPAAGAPVLEAAAEPSAEAPARRVRTRRAPRPEPEDAPDAPPESQHRGANNALILR